MKTGWISRVACALGLMAPVPAVAQDVMTYKGPCDASAAIPLDADHFAVANDESNTLHIYRRGQAAAVGRLSLSKFLGTKRNEESDIEGAAAIGTRVYWITSHGRNGSGRDQPARHRVFATDIRPGAPPSLDPVGKPYVNLLRDLAAGESLKRYKLVDAARLAAEAKGGLNIEGLAATTDGRLLIGLRNPLAAGRAIVIPLQNPAAVIEGEPAQFGAAMELDLGARGIRTMALVGTGYLLVAGPAADKGSFALYRWSGRTGDAAVKLAVDLKDLRPEAVFAIPQTAQVQLLSDDGGVKIAGVECKDLPVAKQAFRSLTVTP